MTYDPNIAAQVFRGLLYCGMAEALGFGLAMLLLAILPTWDEG